MLLGLIEDLQNRWQGGGHGAFSKHVSVWVTPRRSIFQLWDPVARRKIAKIKKYKYLHITQVMFFLRKKFQTNMRD